MEQSTLIFTLEAILADKSRFTALRVDADHMARITINALGAAFERFAH
jgi:hypothetical protein